MENVTYIDHPLVQHKISMLRKKTTGTNEFRTLVEEIATLMGYEALRDLPLEDVEVETPIETCMTPMLAGKKLAIVPILRAGLGMVNGVLSLVPSAKIGHIGLLQASESDRAENDRCHRSDARNRRFSSRCDRLYQAARRKTHQIYVHHRCSGRSKEAS